MAGSPAPPRSQRGSTFKAPWWLRSGHLQTLWPTLLRRPPPLDLRRERLELPDGDFLDLDWAGPDAGGDDVPLVLVLHGLQGSSRSGYARGLLAACTAQGWRSVLMHFRGCSGEPNRLPRSYHSGETGDLRHVCGILRQRHRACPMAAVGYSLGGNVLLKWLGENAPRPRLHAAVAVSVPFDLARAADVLDRGFARLYQWYLVRSLLADVRRKFASMDTPPVDLHEGLSAWSSFWQFDDRVTAPLHGFRDVHDYYARSSSRPYLAAIRTPTLLLQAQDDPFLPPDALPEQAELGPGVTLELSGQGGHVGFVEGRPLRPRYWLEQRITRFLAERFSSAGKETAPGR